MTLSDLERWDARGQIFWRNSVNGARTVWPRMTEIGGEKHISRGPSSSPSQGGLAQRHFIFYFYFLEGGGNTPKRFVLERPNLVWWHTWTWESSEGAGTHAPCPIEAGTRRPPSNFWDLLRTCAHAVRETTAKVDVGGGNLQGRPRLFCDLFAIANFLVQGEAGNDAQI